MALDRTLNWLRHLPQWPWRAFAVLLALAIIVAFATQWTRWEGSERHQVTDDAYLQSDLTSVSAKVPGYVRTVFVQDFQRVRAGEPLVAIVDDDYRADVAQAQANVALAEAQIHTLSAQRLLQQSTVSAAEAVILGTTANLQQSEREVQRAKRLLQGGSGSTEANERADTTHQQLTAQLAQNRAQLEAARRQLEVLAAQIAQAEATRAAHQASLELARINLGYTVIRAPQDGVISQRQVFPGQYVPVGGQITTLAPLPRVWVVANYRETQLTHVRVGQPATITVDSFPGHTLRGHVVALSPGSGASFALLPPDNATGNFTKVVQRVPVRIKIVHGLGPARPLRPGMSVTASVRTK